MLDDGENVEYIMYLLNKLTEDRFTGNIQINFHRGCISNINKLESISREHFVVEVKKY